MKRRWFLVGLLVAAAWLLAACGASPAAQNAPDGPGRLVKVGSAGAYRDITVAELQEMLKNKDFVFINVHIPFEGNIPGTDLSIPYNQIEKYADKLPQDKNAKIVVYCRSGSMSAIAARTLVKMGYTNVYNLAGGMIAWTQAGLPLEMTP